MKYRIALFIGRFQPFHNGHMYSLRKCVDIAEKIIIGVGSSNISGTKENPFNYEVRKEMLEKVIKSEELKNKVIRVVPIADFPSDDDWVEEVKEQAGEFDVVVGNNDWTNDVLSGAGYEIHETGLHNRDKLEGVKIREMVRRGDKEWKERVPKCLVDMIDTNNV